MLVLLLKTYLLFLVALGLHHGTSLVVASGGFSTAAVHGFLVQWLVLWSTGSGPTGFSAEERGFSRRGTLA